MFAGADAAAHAVSPRRTAAAIAAVFFVNGASLASWTARLPEVKAQLGVSDAALGLTLLGTGLGGLAASLASGKAVERYGAGMVTVVTSAAMSMCLAALGLSSVALVVFSVLIVLGAFDGLTDVAMNAQALTLQRRLGRSIITRFHALWSAGAMTGALVAGRAAAAGISVRVQLLVTAAVLLGITAVARTWLVPSPAPVATTTADLDDADSGANDIGSLGLTAEVRTSTPRRLLLRLFAVGAMVALAEQPPNDWAALLLDDRFEISPGVASLGLVATAGGMLIGRIFGDTATDRYGAERTRRGGALLTVIGLIIAATTPFAVTSGLGLLVTGIGLSSLFPLLFRAAGDLTGGSHGAMAAFSSGARLGFILGAPAVGLLADASSITIAVLALAGGAAAIVAATPVSRRTPVGVAP
ncbi:MAG: MFS transporter [Actinomycetota bacterium]|nr:MFS transporter [Actinomycetota bacterium]